MLNFQQNKQLEKIEENIKEIQLSIQALCISTAVIENKLSANSADTEILNQLENEVLALKTTSKILTAICATLFTAIAGYIVPIFLQKMNSVTMIEHLQTQVQKTRIINIARQNELAKQNAKIKFTSESKIAKKI